MKREKRVTKRERKALAGGPRPAKAQAGAGQHIHCVACGRHINQEELGSVTSATATILTCQHGSHFASCTDCVDASQAALDEHDRTGKPVATAAAWH